MADKFPCSPKEAPKTIVYGAFKGMGDLLCAAPVIASELAKGHVIKLLLFPGSALCEWVAYSRLGDEFKQFPGFPPFIDSIPVHKKHPPAYDLLIAPGANAINRLWPLPHYVSLVQMIPSEYRIAVVGLPSDIERMR